MAPLVLYVFSNCIRLKIIVDEHATLPRLEYVGDWFPDGDCGRRPKVLLPAQSGQQGEATSRHFILLLKT
jgi:hypothetical protein